MRLEILSLVSPAHLPYAREGKRAHKTFDKLNKKKTS